MRLFIFLFALLPALFSFAQSDTVYTYFDINKKIAPPETAVYIGKTTKENALWHQQVFTKNDGHLYMDGYFTDEKMQLPEGAIKYYQQNEQIADSCFFVKGQLLSKYRFFTNGQVKNYIIFTHSFHIAKQGGYTEDGHSIDNYIVWQPAIYPDSITGWQKYIKRKTSWHLPAGYLKGQMEGNVEITFTIDSTGAVTNAQITRKSGFIDLDQRALSIIEKSKKWLPAIIDNCAVSSIQKQTIVFANNELNAQANKTISTGLNFFSWMR